MRKQKLEYLASNGNFCIGYLEALAERASDPVARNRILNHALAVSSLIEELRKLDCLYTETKAQNDRLSAALIKFERGIYDEHISKRIEKLKAQLVDHIMEF